MSEYGQGAGSHGKQAAAEGAALPQPPDGAALHDATTIISQTNINQVCTPLDHSLSCHVTEEILDL